MNARASEFTFRPLTRGDFSTLLRWFNAPHAARWYCREGMTLDELEQEYGPIVDRTIPIRAHIVGYQGREIALIEHEKLGAFDEIRRHYRVDDPNTCNCDVIIGEPSLAHRGVGPAMIRAHLERFIFAQPEVRSIVIDPLVDNFIAIRAYEKAGFRFVRSVADDGEGAAVYLLELTREEFFSPQTHAAPFFIRPAKTGELDALRSIDEDACLRYADVGLSISASLDGAFTEGESARWQRSLDAGLTLVACATDTRAPIAFISLARLDGAPFVQQLSVVRAWQGRGVGRALLARAKRWSVRDGALWLTTYGAISFNEPWYARRGFELVEVESCGPELRALDREERRALPAPDTRVVMRYRHADGVETE
ncbi:MAG: GNAT family N-acetyltransferase [Polyangiales bacterium]